MAKISRIAKQKLSVQRLKKRREIFVTNQHHLKAILDLVMKAIFNNSDRPGMRLQEDIFNPLKIDLPAKEYDKVWDVLVSSGLVSPLVGFGNAGKLELTNEGLKIMAQHGGYSNFMDAVNQKNKLHNNPMVVAVNHEVEDTEPDEASGSSYQPES